MRSIGSHILKLRPGRKRSEKKVKGKMKGGITKPEGFGEKEEGPAKSDSDVGPSDASRKVKGKMRGGVTKLVGLGGAVFGARRARPAARAPKAPSGARRLAKTAPSIHSLCLDGIAGEWENIEPSYIPLAKASVLSTLEKR
jgi:hypothetical protein